jgi:hypothetical protein
MKIRRVEQVLDRLRVDQKNLRGFAAETGFAEWRVALSRARAVDGTLVEVGFADRVVDMTVNARAVFDALPRFRGDRVSPERVANALDRELKAQLFWATVTQKWQDIREKGISALGDALKTSSNAFFLLYDERKLVTAKRQVQTV